MAKQRCCGITSLRCSSSLSILVTHPGSCLQGLSHSHFFIFLIWDFLKIFFISLIFSVIGLFAVSSRYFGLFQTVKKTKPITSNRAKCEKDSCSFFFFFFFFFGVLNLFPFVRIAKKMYISPGKKV